MIARHFYSIILLATREPLQNSASLTSLNYRAILTPPLTYFCQKRGVYCPADLPSCQPKRDIFFSDGAGERSRTPDRLITNQLLYQLSYTSFNSGHLKGRDSNGLITLRQRLIGFFLPFFRRFEVKRFFFARFGF